MPASWSSASHSFNQQVLAGGAVNASPQTAEVNFSDSPDVGQWCVGDMVRHGWSLLEQGQTPHALDLLERAWEVSKWQQSPAARSLACRALSAFYHQTANTALEFQFTQLALSAEAELSSQQSVASQFIEQGRRCFLQGDWTSGFRYLDYGIRVCASQADETGVQQIQHLSCRIKNWIDRLDSDPLCN